VAEQGQYQSAVNHLQRVLEISGEMGDHVGDADAFGTIADIYTDMGDLESVRYLAMPTHRGLSAAGRSICTPSCHISLQFIMAY
jgi:hypothetical protein